MPQRDEFCFPNNHSCHDSLIQYKFYFCISFFYAHMRLFVLETFVFRYTIMKTCWNLEPTERPTFSKIAQLIERLLGETPDQVKSRNVWKVQWLTSDLAKTLEKHGAQFLSWPRPWFTCENTCRLDNTSQKKVQADLEESTEDCGFFSPLLHVNNSISCPFCVFAIWIITP